MQVRTTSTQRSYRYLRLSIVGVVVLLTASLVGQIWSQGPLTSVSAAYYTPAQPVFAGSLLAIALALVALSGRSLEQALLDLAALFAPLVALVPTPIERGDVAGLVPACPGDASCVPPDVVPAVGNGMLALAVVGVLGIGAAVVLAVVQGNASRGLRVTIGTAAVVIAGMSLWWVLSPESFLLAAHNAAAIAFFALIASVAALAAWRPLDRAPRRHRSFRRGYAVIAVGIAAALVFVGVVVIARAVGVDLVDATSWPLVFIGESAALVLFAAFWLVQTVELWDEPDPRARAG